jgi:hypothetical protein
MGEVGRRVNLVIKCVHMYVNAKLMPIEIIPGIGGGINEPCRGMNSNVIYLINCKNFCKCHNVPPSSKQ